MNSGIYEIVNLKNGHRYIGSAVNIQKRWATHKSNLKRKAHHNRHLQNAWVKYGCECFAFRVVELCQVEILIDREQHYIDTSKHEYNISPTAGSLLGMKHTTEARAKVSAAKKGTIHTSEHRAKIGAASKGRTATTETRAKMSAAAKNMSPETRAKISVGTKNMSPEARAKKNPVGRVLSDETRAKISASHKGKTNSAETRAKISAAAKKRYRSDATRNGSKQET